MKGIVTSAGRGARKYLRRGRDYKGNVLPSIGGIRGTGRFAHQQLKDREGKGFVVACARDKLRLEEQPSTRQYRTLQRWRPVKSPRTWPRGAGACAALRRVANSCCPCPLKWPLSSMTIRHFCTNHSPNVARRPRAMRQSDAPRRALSEPPRPFFRAGNRSASRSERLRGRGRREERKPSFSVGLRGRECCLRKRGALLLAKKHLYKCSVC